MAKHANLYIELLCGKKTMRFATIPKDTFLRQSRTYEVRFEEIDENLNGFISLNDIRLNDSDKKTTKRLHIPLDSEIIEGLNDLMLLISAFTYPEEDMSFCLYKGHSQKLTHEFFLSAL